MPKPLLLLWSHDIISFIYDVVGKERQRVSPLCRFVIYTAKYWACQVVSHVCLCLWMGKKETIMSPNQRAEPPGPRNATEKDCLRLPTPLIAAPCYPLPLPPTVQPCPTWSPWSAPSPRCIVHHQAHPPAPCSV